MAGLTIPRSTTASMAAPPPPPTSSFSFSSSSSSSTLRLPFKSIKLYSPLSLAPSTKLARRVPRITCEAQGAAVEVAPVSDDSWQSLVLECDTAVLVEFWAPWCGPCRMIHPVIDELAKEYTGKLKCYKVNTDECPSIATRYGIRSIPTVIVFKNGEKKDAVIGAVPKTTLTTCIEKFI